jgi:hypothetical protein
VLTLTTTQNPTTVDDLTTPSFHVMVNQQRLFGFCCCGSGMRLRRTIKGTPTMSSDRYTFEDQSKKYADIDSTAQCQEGSGLDG